MKITNKKTTCDYSLVIANNSDYFKRHSRLAKELYVLGFNADDDTCINASGEKTIFCFVKDKNDKEGLKINASKAFAMAKKLKISNLELVCNADLALDVIEGILLGDYSFDKYKSQKNKSHIKTIYVKMSDKLFKQVSQIETITQSVHFVRDLVNETPENIFPQSFVRHAQNAIKDLPISQKVLSDKDLEKEGMNAFLAVNRASQHGARLLHLTYKPKTAKKRVVLVGKGLTYDSGGLSIKPGDYMVTMKSDKSGASAVLGTIIAVAKLGLDLEVHAIMGLAENMVGGDAYKPDDILCARNKKTIEVRNTDAEGRLVLADCLSYACELKPDYIFDVATLTGACVVALGEYTIGIMGHNDKLKSKMSIAATKAGELTGILPFNRYLKRLIKSEIADVSNTSSSRYGGAITAGLFLDNFVDEKYKQKWLHLDIAGPAYVQKSWGYNPFGASGAGLRMLVEFMRGLN